MNGCELLIRITTKPGALRNKQTEPGDVVAACPAGWGWGRRELANPEWAIVHIPGVSHEAFVDMEKPLCDAQGFLVLKRQHHFDHATLMNIIGSKRRVSLTQDDAVKLLATRKAKQPPGKIVLA